MVRFRETNNIICYQKTSFMTYIKHAHFSILFEEPNHLDCACIINCAISGGLKTIQIRNYICTLQATLYILPLKLNL